MIDLQTLFNHKLNTLMPLIMLWLLAGCGQKSSSVIGIKPIYQGKVLTCQQIFHHMGTDWRYQQLQFFISELEVKTVTSAGQDTPWQRLSLPKTPYQNGQVALLGELCAASNNSEQNTSENSGNWQLQLPPGVDASTLTQIRFNLGVPFALNHQNPLQQQTPLNLPSMFWAWRTGHKFLRLELSSASDHWLFHLGSTGCSAPSPVRAPTEQCRQPNRVQLQ